MSLKLSSNDQTPALEVNLIVAAQQASNGEQTVAVGNTPTLQEINLNDANVTQSNAQHVTIPSDPSANFVTPSLAELPSYNEALRLKKLEANNSNDLPPAYFPPGSEQTRIPIDPADVGFFSSDN